MRSLFTKRAVLFMVKMLACAALIGFSHVLFRQDAAGGYAALWLLWLYLGVPFCLIGILTGGNPDRVWTGLWLFTGRLLLTLAGIFGLLMIGGASMLVVTYEKVKPLPLWVWSCIYYALLLVIWQPRVLTVRYYFKEK